MSASASPSTPISSGVPAVIRRASGAPNAPMRAHDDPSSEQRVVRRGGIADVDEEEVRDRRPGRLEPVLAEHILEQAHGSPVRRAAPLELVGGAERLASAASWPAEATSNARRTLPIAAMTSSGPMP